MTLNVLKSLGGEAWYAEAPDWRSDDPHAVLRIGVSKHAISNKSKRGQTWALGQLYGVLLTGLISTTHIFGGLRRSMCIGDDMEADNKKLTFTWPARHDARLVENSGVWEISRIAAEVKTVFAVNVSLNSRESEFPNIYGWAEHWTWLDADEVLIGAPVDWETRYDSRLWSKG
jgi:hypothetical protein